MADAPYGVYASFRLPGGQLVSSNRETVEQLQKDIEEMLGADGATKFWASFEPKTEEARPVAPVADAAAVSNPVVPQADAGNVPVAGGNPTVDDLPANGFENCEKCGALKDKWKPGGVSQAGKPYPGFFSCPNWSTHK